MNIIFLDVDGVLNSLPYFKDCVKDENGRCEISDFHLKKLAEIYHTCDAKIVLSSTWRHLKPTTEGEDSEATRMYQYLMDSLAKYDMEVIGEVPSNSGNRPLEISDWLDSREDKETINFVSLDDDFDEEEYAQYDLENHLVHTLYFCKNLEDGGLQQKHVDKAIEILKGNY